MAQTPIEYLIEQVKAKEWQDLYIWHKEEVFEEAKRMEWEQMNKVKQNEKK
jgi:hypothetical protein